MKNYIVFDLEWNQSPVGKEGTAPGLPFEIIEIGAVKLDENLKQVSEFRRLIRPVVYDQIHYMISEVIHMDMQELMEQGEDFTDAMEEFLEWCGEDYVFCTWGSMDLTELQRNMNYFFVENPFPRPLFYYDVQKLYSLLYRDGKEKHSLEQAVEEMGLRGDRAFHQALDDAYYTGCIMTAMDFEKVKVYQSIDYYRPPMNIEEEIYVEFPNYSKYVSRIFDTKEDAIADKRVTDMVCYRCHRMLRKKIRWFSVNQKFYFGLAICPQHGLMKGKIRMKKTDDGDVYVVKTQKLVSDEEAKLIYERKDEAARKRNERNKMRRHKK